MASAAAASLRAFGVDRGLPFPLEDIVGAEVVLMIGANPAETMPPLMQYFEEQRRRRGQFDRGRPAPHAHGRGGAPAPAASARHR
jgi:anaerobic selenocysteine-containing dehydrogenase